ncbi:hypothetical protein GN956_G19460 [Arapaima gigas]
MASGHTVMHLQRKLKDLQRQRCRRGGSQEPRVLGMVVPTMRTPAPGPPLASSSRTLHSHRGLQLQPNVVRGAGRDLDDYTPVTRTLTTSTKDLKDPAPSTKELQHPAAELIPPPPEVSNRRRAIPAVTLPLSTLTSDPWRADTSQAFPVVPAIGYLPPPRPPAEAPFFQSDLANTADFPPHSRELLWPLPNYPGVFPDPAIMPPSYQCPTFVPHVPLHPSWYRLDMSPLLYKKTPIHPSELSAFSPLRLSHPLARDTFGVRTPAFGPRSSSSDGRKVKEGTVNHRSKETKPVSELSQHVLTNPPKCLQKKECKGQRLVAMGRTPNREGGGPDKVPVDIVSSTKPYFNRHGRGSSTPAPSWSDFEDLSQTREFSLWPWVSLQHTEGGKKSSNSLLIPGKPQLLSKEGPLSHVSPPVKAKLRGGLNRTDGEKCSPQVNSGSHLKRLLGEPQDSLKALDLSARIRSDKNLDKHKVMGSSLRRSLDESYRKGPRSTPHGHQEDCSPALAENYLSDTQAQTSARSSSMPNLVLTHSPRGECERMKGFSRSNISTKQELRRKDFHLIRGSPQGGAQLNVRVPGGGHPEASGHSWTKCNGNNANKRVLDSPGARGKQTAHLSSISLQCITYLIGSIHTGEEPSQESTPAKTIRLSHALPPAYPSPYVTSESRAQCEVGTKLIPLYTSRIMCATVPLGKRSHKRSFTHTNTDMQANSYQDCADALSGTCGQTEGVSVLDLTTSSLSSDEETEDMSLKHRWHGVEGVLETYRSYIEETTVEEKVLQEELRLSKERNKELNLIAKNLSKQIQDLQASKEKLEAEQQVHEVALVQLRGCLVLI